VLDIPGAGPPRDETHDDQQRQVLLAIFCSHSFQLACPVGSSSTFTVVSGHSFLVPLGSKTAPLSTHEQWEEKGCRHQPRIPSAPAQLELSHARGRAGGKRSIPRHSHSGGPVSRRS
jgi:hypothetical protein